MTRYLAVFALDAEDQADACDQVDRAEIELRSQGFALKAVQVQALAPDTPAIAGKGTTP